MSIIERGEVHRATGRRGTCRVLAEPLCGDCGLAGLEQFVSKAAFRQINEGTFNAPLSSAKMSVKSTST